ncbi:endonuclease [Asticcacaulis endophyticus]|uniref:Endonuclease n=1 Tax=Asticcacaulis endophyticus TaxID=1395890 RepID=A0A918Q545_9CAUL|nr:endonuclease [Asticcacaulis endophyticus]GGZ32939.1 hypothetical protein GCM10011273_19030 [Asticcacaulis endophyticus]
MAKPDPAENRYKVLIEKLFFNHWKEGITEFAFDRRELETVAAELKIVLPRNLGDVPYYFRYRNPFPDAILKTQPEGLEWVIQGAGKGLYRFRLVKFTRIVPSTTLISIPIPDATPEVIRAYALDDEQALLAIVRYNRLVDTFLGLTTYSLQNHLRTTVKQLGQIEIDELYVGLDKYGCHYVIPVQAKGGKDQIGVVQIAQDLAFSNEKFPEMRCRPIAAQFMPGGVVALFELTIDDEQVKVVEERHYKLIPADQIDAKAARNYRN